MKISSVVCRVVYHLINLILHVLLASVVCRVVYHLINLILHVFISLIKDNLFLFFFKKVKTIKTNLYIILKDDILLILPTNGLSKISSFPTKTCLKSVVKSLKSIFQNNFQILQTLGLVQLSCKI